MEQVQPDRGREQAEAWDRAERPESMSHKRIHGRPALGWVGCSRQRSAVWQPALPALAREMDAAWVGAEDKGVEDAPCNASCRHRERSVG